MNSLLDFFNDPLVLKIAKLLLWILAIIIFIGFFRRVLKRRIDNVSVRYKAQKGVEIIGYVLISLLILMAFTVENIKDYTIIIGLFTAGITFTLQELILSIAGSFYIFFVKVYKPGDRNELNILITYDSDVALAKKIVMEKATDFLSEYTKNSIARWEEMVEHYYIENATIAPTLAISPTDNWIAINLRYITDYKLRRITKHELFEQIVQALMATDDKVKLASTTLQLLKIPELDIHLKQ